MPNTAHINMKKISKRKKQTKCAHLMNHHMTYCPMEISMPCLHLVLLIFPHDAFFPLFPWCFVPLFEFIYHSFFFDPWLWLLLFYYMYYTPFSRDDYCLFLLCIISFSRWLQNWKLRMVIWLTMILRDWPSTSPPLRRSILNSWLTILTSYRLIRANSSTGNELSIGKNHRRYDFW